ncbi:sensor histidine kinase [Xanthomonas hortorum pv. gardneri]|uniref:sensor histidine kinase n=1 Tax=Xanthomonas hortorum TaxID=56454 RepID=UPI002FE38260
MPVCARTASTTGAAGHRSHLPEVTFCMRTIAEWPRGRQHRRMNSSLPHLLHPLRLAGAFTIAAVALSFMPDASAHGAWRWGVLAGFTALFLLHSLLRPLPVLRNGALLLQAVLALLLVWMEPHAGTAPVLLVLLVAQAGMAWPPLRVLPLALALNAGMYAVLVQAGIDRALSIVSIYAGFQAFAALTAHYARSAERARDALAYVNAYLLATRALLADSARDAERLRLARELHDVAGHKLTAMSIHLRLLRADPMLAPRQELAMLEGLARELLGDIRSVVQSLRDDAGLDLHTALHALAAPFPKPVLQLQIDPAVRVSDPQIAEALLRLVQEALTNAARHGEADTVQVSLHTHDGQLHIDIQDDGHCAEQIREGNGIAGMRERLAALHGQLQLGRAAHGGMQLTARLPA